MDDTAERIRAKARICEKQASLIDADNPDYAYLTGKAVAYWDSAKMVEDDR